MSQVFVSIALSVGAAVAPALPEKGCEAPSVEISGEPAAAVGELLTFEAVVSAGSPPYVLAWDLNDDGAPDFDGETVETRYSSAFDSAIVLTVTDAASCQASASLPLTVTAAELTVSQTGPAEERCGDGDGVLEPGEQGSIPLQFNNPSALAAFDTVAIFSRAASTGAAKFSGGPDTFGYTFADNSEASCIHDFVAIEGTAPRLTYSGLTVGDESAARVTLAGSGVSIYGQTYRELAMSSNGYLALNAEDNGQDLRPRCPLPAAPSIGPNDGRLLVYHDDLIEKPAGGAYYQYFEQCPRGGRAGDGCHVFQWQGYDFGTGGFSGPGPRPASDFDFQALIYEASGDIVFQYRGDNPTRGANASVGLLGPGAADALQYSCQEQRVPAGRSICFSAPAQNEPPPVSRRGVRLETPALSLGDLSPGQSVTTKLEFTLEPDAVCGTRAAFDYLGATVDGGYVPPGELQLDVVLGGEAGVCDSGQVCSIDAASRIEPEPGLLFDPRRPGNGVDAQLVGDNLALLWYTASAEHYPQWYFVAGPYQDNQVDTAILDFRFAGNFGPADPSFVEVGSAHLTWLAEDEMVFVWQLDGRRWGERMSLLRTSDDPTNRETSGQYFNPEENGWGIAVNRQGSVELQTVYIYDQDGLPVWLLSRTADESGTADLDGFQWVHCPGCPWIAPVSVSAGSLRRAVDPDGSSRLSTGIVLPPPMAGSWDRTDLRLQKIN